MSIGDEDFKVKFNKLLNDVGVIIKTMMEVNTKFDSLKSKIDGLKIKTRCTITAD